ncbi:DNA-binding XRE family transcriptional regulator [Fluviicoccus keumensis]|uniref:DNA-binding XRE family transcriptional regulator n=1 Tax=Fluviicoccus keumensis TaxID=1435465 RepID=A0A4Q7Z5I6_9GAMM|nr:helix-turn-helix transcriptional regulator [Fluviicoccus keumensis]RZU45101.1 DNA-binding XRE family transcriptional regulator [Fluviicoccus keumensis]
MLDLILATPAEICSDLGSRLREQRLAQALTQTDLALRAGVSAGTVKNLEGKGQSSLESLIRIVVALGLTNQLQTLFTLQTDSIAALARAEKAKRQRAPRRNPA